MVETKNRATNFGTKRSWLKCAWHEPNRKFCREKGEVRTWILLIKVLASWPFGPYWFLIVLCLPSVQACGRREMEHSLRISESIFGKQLFGEWDRDCEKGAFDRNGDWGEENQQYLEMFKQGKKDLFLGCVGICEIRLLMDWEQFWKKKKKKPQWTRGVT